MCVCARVYAPRSLHPMTFVKKQQRRAKSEMPNESVIPSRRRISREQKVTKTMNTRRAVRGGLIVRLYPPSDETKANTTIYAIYMALRALESVHFTFHSILCPSRKKYRAKRQKYGLACFYYTSIGRNTPANIIDTRPSVLLSQECFAVTERERRRRVILTHERERRNTDDPYHKIHSQAHVSNQNLPSSGNA